MAAGGDRVLFPVLSPRAIHEFLRTEFARSPESDFEPDLAEIESPTDKSMGRLYSEIFCLTMGCRMELEAPFRAYENIEYPDIYREAIPRMMFLRAMKKLTSAVGISDFGIKDIMAPTKKRTVYILSGIVNFLKFYKKYEDELEEAETRLEDIVAERNARDEEVLALREKLARMKEKRVEEEGRVLAVKRENEKLEKEISGLNSEQFELNQEKEELKTKLQEIQDTDTAMTVHLITLKEQQSELEANVVKSPDRVKSEITALKENHHHLTQEGFQVKEEIRAKKDSIEFMEEMGQMLEKLNAKLDEKKRRQEEIKQYMKQMEEFDEQKVEAKKKLKRLITEEEHDKRKLDMLRAKKAQLTKQHEMRRDANDNEQERFSVERKEILERKEMNEKLMRELEVKEQQTPKEVEEIQEEHKQLEEKIGGMVRKTIARANKKRADIQRRAETYRDKLKRAGRC